MPQEAAKSLSTKTLYAISIIIIIIIAYGNASQWKTVCPNMLLSHNKIINRILTEVWISQQITNKTSIGKKETVRNCHT